MSQYVIDFGTLNNIANAIREKGNTAATMTPLQMPDYIRSIQTGGGGGGGDLPAEAFNLTGDCDYRFRGWDWFIEQYGNQITTQDITSSQYMFTGSNVTEIPFELNYMSGNGHYCYSMFNSCSNLTYIAPMNNMYPMVTAYMFANCSSLKELPEMNNWNFEYMHGDSWGNYQSMFTGCSALLSVPEEFLKEIDNGSTYSWSSPLSEMFNGCGALGEIRGLRVPVGDVAENLFVNTFNYCFRVKEIIFATQEDGSPYTGSNLSYQHIDLTQGVGYVHDSGFTWMMNFPEGNLYYSSDIKLQPDSWTDDINYSRYNRESAINTINSLPDCSSGSENIISFMRAAGTYTDGGAIGDMTEEEIAIAAAKGWTISFVD